MADIHKEQELPTAPPQAQEIPDGKPPVPITPPAIKAKKKKHILTPRKQLLIKSMMKDLTNLAWRELPFIGCELKHMAVIKSQPWEFSYLADQLRSGVLANLGHPVYVWMQAEPHCLSGAEITTVPVIMAYVCKVPPPALVSQDSVQSTDAATRALLPLGAKPKSMEEEQLSWGPYIPERLLPRWYPELSAHVPIYALKWYQRATQFGQMNEFQTHHYEYLNIYHLLPQILAKEEQPEVRSVVFTFEKDGKKWADLDFDKDVDRIATWLESRLETKEEEEKRIAEETKAVEEQQTKPKAKKSLAAKEDEKNEKKEEEKKPVKIPSAYRAELEAALRAAFQTARAISKEAWDNARAKINALSPQDKEALENMKVYKFYPEHPKIDVTPAKSLIVNRYFGNAAQAFGGGIVLEHHNQLATESTPITEATPQPQKKLSRKGSLEKEQEEKKEPKPEPMEEEKVPEKKEEDRKRKHEEGESDEEAPKEPPAKKRRTKK